MAYDKHAQSARGAEKSAEIGRMPGTLEPDPGNAGVGIKDIPLISALHTRKRGNFLWLEEWL